MTIINSLPSDLVFMVISAVYFYEHEVPEWTSSLVLLAVCREWRRIGTPIIYGTAVVRVHSNINPEELHDSDATTNVWMSTNLGHIKQNGHLQTVKRLFFRSPDNDAFDNADLMTIQLLLTMFDQKGAERVLESIDAPGGRLNKFTLADGVAKKLAEFLPNVNELCIDGYVHDMALSGFFYETRDQYSGQLQRVADTVPNGGLLAAAPKLKRMAIHTVPLDEGETFAKIIPPSLNSLELVFHAIFYWDHIVDRNWSALENLTCMHLNALSTSPWPLSTVEEGPAYNQSRVLLPNLTTLVICDVPLSLENCRELMRSPLKSLQYAGGISVAGMLFQQRGLNSVLENVVLNLGYEGCGCEFAQATNKIIARTLNIKKVFLNLYIPEDIIPTWSKVNWPHLTHVCFEVSSGVDNLIQIIPAMPNVVYLEISYDISKKGSQKKLKSALKKLKRDMNGPFASKIQRLIIQLTNRNPQPLLFELLAVLKEYLPLVDKVYVAGLEYCVAI